MGSGGAHRLTARLVLVWMSPEGRPARWPDRIRAVLTAHLETTA
jgi:acyl-CoA thioesterase FadM